MQTVGNRSRIGMSDLGAMARRLIVAATLLVAAFMSHASATPGFIENRGQVHEDVLYYMPGSPVSLFLTQDALVFDLQEELDEVFSADPMNSNSIVTQARCAVRVWFERAGTSHRIEAREKRGTRLNYFLGNDPVQWQIDVPVFNEIVYRDAWPGADLVIRPSPVGLAYEIESAGGMEIGEIRPVCEGAQGVTLQIDGSHVIETSVGNLVHHPIDAEAIMGEFVIEGNSSRSTGQNRLDGQGLVWSTYLGGSDFETFKAIQVSAEGNPVVCGYGYSTDFPVTAGSYDVTHDGIWDVILAEMDDSGSQLNWGTYLGADGSDAGFGLDMTPSGDWVVGGFTGSASFPVTSGVYDTSHNGISDVFVAKLSSTGNALIWSTFVGGSQSEECHGIAVGPSGQVFGSGWTISTDLPTTAGAFDQSPNGVWDAVAFSLNETGTDLVWGTYLGSAGLDWSYRIDVREEHPVVLGSTDSAGFPTTAGAFDQTFNGSKDLFVVRLEGGSGALVWSTYLGGSLHEGSSPEDYDLCIKQDDNIVISGATFSDDFPVTPGSYDETYNGNLDSFVCELDSSGSELTWSTFVGGTSSETVHGVELSPAECPVITMECYSTDFPITADTYDSSHNGGYDVAIAKFDPTGSELLYSTFMGGGGHDRSYGIATGELGETFVAGQTPEGFPTTAGAFDETHNGGPADGFVAKFDLPVVAACCIDEICYILTEVTCVSAGGEYKGDGVICEPDTCIPSDVDWDAELPAHISLSLPSPHPVCGELNIGFSLPTAGHITLRVLDPQGRVVATLADEWRDAGYHSYSWQSGDNVDLSTGVYFMKLSSDAGSVSQKILVLD